MELLHSCRASQSNCGTRSGRGGVIGDARHKPKHAVAENISKHVIKDTQVQDAAELSATEEPPDGAPSNNRSPRAAIAEKAASKAAAPARAARAGSAPA